MSNYYLIVDQGGHNTRALVFNAAGEAVADARCDVATQCPADGFVEQDPAEMVTSLRTVCDGIARQLGNDVSKIVSAALVTQRSSLVCWDKTSGEALTPVLSWQDVRAEDSQELAALEAEELTITTGLRPSPHYGASKIRWCLDNLPEVQQALLEERLVCGPMACFLLYHLNGGQQLAVDPANASRTLLWNIRLGDWDSKLLEHFGIPAQVLPPLKPSLSDYGELDIGEIKVPIQLLNGDQCAAFYGRGGMQEGTVYINAGTGAFIATPWPEDKFPPSNLLKTLVLDDGNTRSFVAEGTVNGAGSALDWAAKQLQLNGLGELDNWCQSEMSPPLFLNGVGGLGAPFWRSQFRSEFIGGVSAASRMVAVLESIVFLLKINLDLLHSGDTELTHIVLGGGVGSSSYFCQKLSSLSGLPVFRPKEVELTSRGAAYLLAGQPEGWHQQRGQKFEPRSDRGLEERYRHWRTAIAERIDDDGLFRS